MKALWQQGTNLEGYKGIGFITSNLDTALANRSPGYLPVGML
jgi:hypothetical protein